MSICPSIAIPNEQRADALTVPTVSQHWMGAVEQELAGSLRPSRGVAAARMGRAARAKAATRENMLAMMSRAEAGVVSGLSVVDLKPEDTLASC